MDKQNYKTALFGMKMNLGMFTHLRESFAEDAQKGEAEAQMIAGMMGVVGEMAEKYHEMMVTGYRNMFGEEYEDGSGFGGADRESETGTASDAGAGVSEAGDECCEVAGEQGTEPAGVGGDAGEGAEHGGGDRDRNDADTRE